MINLCAHSEGNKIEIIIIQKKKNAAKKIFINI